jgi:hypothetical protein
MKRQVQSLAEVRAKQVSEKSSGNSADRAIRSEGKGRLSGVRKPDIGAQQVDL